jgi:ClpP class serine protease
MRLWLLQDDVLEAMRDARQLLNHEPTAEERSEFLAAQKDAYARKEAALPRNVVIAGETAQINVRGVLTEEPDCFAMMFGGGNTTYASIREGIAAAEADPAVKEIVLNIKSPGGSVDGLFETLSAIERAQKPMRSVAPQATSAAYALAAVAGPIEAPSEGSVYGSIGVATRMRKDPNVIDIASTAAPNKRPNVATEEGVAHVQSELDAVHELFANRIAAGRSRVLGKPVDVAHVNSNFGRGGTLLAGEAKKRNMIDATPRPIKRAPYLQQTASADDGGESKKENHMDLETLKASHPAVYAAAVEAGKTEGAASERKRVNAHFKMAESAGDPKLALPFIASGVSVSDEEAFAAYSSAAMNRNAQGARQADADQAAVVTKDAKTATTEAGDLEDRTAAALKAGG